MKSLIYTILIFSIAIAFLSSCSKYEEGPNITLLTKKTRLCGDWMLYEVTDVFGNSIDSTNYSENIYIDRDGTFKKTMTEYNAGSVVATSSIYGSWKFVNEKEELALINVSQNIDLRYTIVRLSNYELKLLDENTKTTYYFVPL
jgi:hypothetical protein